MKKIIAFVLTIIITLSIPLNAYSITLNDNDDNVKCKSAILMCADTGDILYEKNAYEHLSPASITKILALLVVLEKLDANLIKLEDKVIASENAVSMGGSQIWLEVGEEMSVDELLKAVVIASANDAITALGEYIAGSSTGFIKLMNDKAVELGLENTNFENCTGLDDTVSNHYSCAYDLAVISKEVIKHEIIKKYSTTWLDSLRNGKTELNNTNKLVNTYNGITGLKTGTTSNAGFCLSATATRDNMNLIAVVLGADTSKERFDSAAYLLDWGFANYKIVEPQIDKTQIRPVKIKNGVIKSIVPAVSNYEKVLIEKGNDEFEYEYVFNENIVAPVKVNDKLGKIIVKSNDNVIGHIDLIADNDILEVTLKDIFLQIIKNI